MSYPARPWLWLAVVCSACATGGPADLAGGPVDDASPPDTDRATPAPDARAADAAAPPGADARDPKAVDHDAAALPDTPPLPTGDKPGAESFSCTLLIGINATAEWYREGFEKLVDDSRWELVRVHSGFVTLWADPNSGAWSTAPTSPCAQNAKNPDRIIYVALQFDYTTLEQWLPPLTATVKNLQAKYPGVKRIELATFVRAPGNKACPQREAKRSTIAPALDEAIAKVVASNPGLVVASPKFEAATCSEFSGNPPHPSKAGGAAWAKLIAEHYGLGR